MSCYMLKSATKFAFIVASAVSVEAADQPWKKHVVFEGEHTNTAVAADFTGDGKPDIISNSGGKTRLFVAPTWTQHIIDETPGHNFIHSEHFDVDDDGDDNVEDDAAFAPHPSSAEHTLPA